MTIKFVTAENLAGVVNFDDGKASMDYAAIAAKVTEQINLNPQTETTAEFRVYGRGGNPLEDLKVPGSYYIVDTLVQRAIEAPGQAAGILHVNASDTRHSVVWEWICPFRGITAMRVFQNNRWHDWEVVNYRNISLTPSIPRTMIVTTGSSSSVDLYMGNTTESGMAKAKGLNVYAPTKGYQAYNTGMSGQIAEYTLLVAGGLKPKITFPDGEIPAHGGKVNITLTLEGAQNTSIVNGKWYELDNGRKGTIQGAPSSPTWTTVDGIKEATPVFTDFAYPADISGWNKYRNCIQIIVTGKNDISGGATADQVSPILQKITDCFQPNRYIVCTQFANFDYSASQLEEINKLNEWTKKRYGNLVFDLAAYVTSDEAFTAAGVVDKTEKDLQAVASGKLPPSLSKDGGRHMAPAVADAAMRKIVDKIKAMVMY